MTSPTDERLMRYLDGEVDAEEARDIELWLMESREARSALSSLERVHDAVVAIGDDIGSRGDGIADAVMARLGENGAADNVVGRIGVVRERARGRAGRRVIGLAPALGLGLAAAAAVVMYLRPVATPARRGATAAVTAALPSSPSGEVAVLDEATGAEPEVGAAIESVDFGAQAGTIFMVPGGHGANETETPVVWLMDDAAPGEGRMAPL